MHSAIVGFSKFYFIGIKILEIVSNLCDRSRIFRVSSRAATTVSQPLEK